MVNLSNKKWLIKFFLLKIKLANYNLIIIKITKDDQIKRGHKIIKLKKKKNRWWNENDVCVFCVFVIVFNTF